jgi:hypothetical protein
MFGNVVAVEVLGELILCKAVFFFFRLLRVILYYYEKTPITDYCGKYTFADRHCYLNSVDISGDKESVLLFVQWVITRAVSESKPPTEKEVVFRVVCLV